MKTVTTTLGNVEITDARIVKASGYGQYTIIVNIVFNGKNTEIKLHSTDSKLFDAANVEANYFEIVINRAKYIIERAIYDCISTI